MPRIGPTQRVRPAAAPARVQNTQVRTANFTAPGSGRLNLSQTASPASAVNAINTRTAAATSCCCTACTGLECLDRTRFFSGQLLTDADLNNEQSYMLAKNRLHNRYLNGWGVVCGLQVTCSECDGWVTVNPGYAIDPCGNDIIVCSAQSFNVLQAIQMCCTPQNQTPNCSPLRYSPPPTCQDMSQKWCITVQYQEQATQMVTPLQPMANTGCGCGCGSSTTSSPCQCGGNGSMAGSAGASSTSSSTAACEPTRILEGFQFGVCALPAAESTTAQPGTMLYQFQQCTKNLAQLAQQAPENLDTMWTNGNQQGVCQAVCNYVVTVHQYFAKNQTLTYCSALDDLNSISVPTLASGAQLADYQKIRNEVLVIVLVAWFNCMCLAVIPQCPPPACDSRVPLACVTIQNGVIQEICHFECRKQLIGPTALNYWFEPIFNAFSTLFADIAERYCCGGAVRQKDPTGYVASNTAYNTENLTSNGMTSGAMFNRIVSSFVAQKMGAGLVNMINPNLRAVDLSPYVGKTLDDAQGQLAKQFTLDIQNVETDSSWDLAATTAASQFAPTAVSVGQPVTLYVKNRLIVGLEVTNPTRSLQLQIQNLTSTVSTLQTQLSNLQAQSGPTPSVPTGSAGDSAPAPPEKKKK